MLFGEFLFLPIALTDCFCMFELCPCFQLLKFYDGQNLLLNAIGYLIILCTGLCLQEITCMIYVEQWLYFKRIKIQNIKNEEHYVECNMFAIKLQVENELMKEFTLGWDPFNLLFFLSTVSEVFICVYWTKRFSRVSALS